MKCELGGSDSFSKYTQTRGYPSCLLYLPLLFLLGTWGVKQVKIKKERKTVTEARNLTLRIAPTVARGPSLQSFNHRLGPGTRDGIL